MCHKIVLYAFIPDMQASKEHKAKSWDQHSLKDAIHKVSEGMSVRSAATAYDIPKSTLYDYVTGKVMLGCKPGPSLVLTSDEEQMLVECALEMSKIGYGRTRQQIFEMVKQILDKNCRPNPFPNNYPGKDLVACLFALPPRGFSSYT